jgi:formylglycine-generating enzyme required for sulfatase activity
MNKFICFLIVVSTFSCQRKYDVVRKEGKSFENNPPGVVWIKDSIYMDRMEIRNLDYWEYLHWLLRYQPEQYNAAYPDTLVWNEKNCYNQPYVHYYFTHPAYKNYPVVGVSYEQAQDFCKWRTARVKEFIAIQVKNKNKNAIRLQNIEYRLPTKKEWEYAASCGDIELQNKNDFLAPDYGYDKLTAENNLPKVWVKETLVLFGGLYGNDLTIPVTTVTPNKFGLHNMIGNVAEMISEKGISKGGSFLHSLYESAISESIVYTKPEPWLGFRCVCVVKK